MHERRDFLTLTQDFLFLSFPIIFLSSLFFPVDAVFLFPKAWFVYRYASLSLTFVIITCARMQWFSSVSWEISASQLLRACSFWQDNKHIYYLIW